MHPPPGTNRSLQAFFEAHPKLALAYSGGVDSVYLLYAARQAGCDVKPYFVHTQFQPAFEFDDAQELAEQIGVQLTVLREDILSHEAVRLNPADRCYHCKRALFERLIRQAQQDGYPLVVDGSNASDDEGDRPGMRALRELGVRSPLREAGLGKAEIRKFSNAAGLRTWDKPAYACLATRVPTGTAIQEEALNRVERAEDALRGLGFQDLRVRLYGDAARIQLKPDDLARAVSMQERILALLEADFDAVLLDLKGRG